eukprot:825258-Rhodomonas_salina.1
MALTWVLRSAGDAEWEAKIAAVEKEELVKWEKTSPVLPSKSCAPPRPCAGRRVRSSGRAGGDLEIFCARVISR